MHVAAHAYDTMPAGPVHNGWEQSLYLHCLLGTLQGMACCPLLRASRAALPLDTLTCAQVEVQTRGTHLALLKLFALLLRALVIQVLVWEPLLNTVHATIGFHFGGLEPTGMQAVFGCIAPPPCARVAPFLLPSLYAPRWRRSVSLWCS